MRHDLISESDAFEVLDVDEGRGFLGGSHLQRPDNRSAVMRLQSVVEKLTGELGVEVGAKGFHKLASPQWGV